MFIPDSPEVPSPHECLLAALEEREEARAERPPSSTWAGTHRSPRWRRCTTTRSKFRLMNTAADEARLLEEELDDDPDERGEILLEAAAAWRRAGNHDRSAELLTEAIALGEEHGSYAKIALADLLFELGRENEARAQLDSLRTDRPESPEPFHRAAVLMAERHELDQALAWFDLTITLLDTDELAESYVTVGRRQVRRELGLAPDELDESVEHLDRDMDDLVRRLRSETTEGRPIEP